MARIIDNKGMVSLSFTKNWAVLEELKSTKDGPTEFYHSEDWVAGVSPEMMHNVMQAGVVKSSSKSDNSDTINFLKGEI